MSLITQVSTLATRVGTEFKTVYSRLGSLSSLATTDKTSLVSAINEVRSSAVAGASINDATTATTSTWSSSKTNTAISTAVSGLVNGAPTTLDTLKEISDQLAADESGATAMATAIGNRVRFDAAQTLTGPQKTQAQTNMDAASATAVGDTTTNFVTVFESALV